MQTLDLWVFKIVKSRYKLEDKNMRERTKLKYKINYNRAFYNFRTKKYKSGEDNYLTYEQARSNQWKCEKCHKLLANLKELKLHKLEYHSY